MAIPDRFAHDDNIGNHILQFKSPEMGPDSPESDLDFVSDAYSTGGPDVPECSLQITFGWNDLSPTRKERLSDESGDGTIARLDDFLHFAGITYSSISTLPLEGSSIAVCQRPTWTQSFEEPTPPGPLNL